ncbi:hypothetical protein PHLGIDRAFT_109236 [Phlebiopsis gigantea 11061_1 CR5-6]|uniref:NADH:flavin oxidoreductase/NADH oxidase N-terminal domain-containing protein n=1 Tax=Phlebiopsis gigantea (strain 11061_1 CR5-6) TaxID=745531 RepID=A0A0C3S3V8_PHLG1|nr:hypothetical protein PHLGIDRAFT_109236 [Phlebiopsis gigantea 11061_1 CR5-6]
MSQVPFLSQPLALGDLTLKNRNIMASLTRNRNVPTNVPNDIVKEYYVQRARGGASLILSEGTLVAQQGTEWPHAPGIWSEEQVAAWRKITDAVHEAGAYMFCQLWHVGRVSHPDMPEQKAAGKPVPAPSAIAAYGGKFRQLPGEPGYVTPTAVKDPWTIVEEFRHAAKMAKKAGFDGVDLHSANGYLPHQFLDYSANQRTDQWGGSVENRCRFGLEVIKAMVDVWGPARVGIKVSPCGGYNDVGMPLPDTLATFNHYITELASLKLAYIQIVRYSYFTDAPARVKPGEPQPEGGKPWLRGVPHDVFDKLNPTPTRLLVNGGVTPQEAEAYIKDGVVDAAVFGVMWIANPDFHTRLEKGLAVNTQPDFVTFHHGVGDDTKAGYTTYPFAEESS